MINIIESITLNEVKLIHCLRDKPRNRAGTILELYPQGRYKKVLTPELTSAEGWHNRQSIMQTKIRSKPAFTSGEHNIHKTAKLLHGKGIIEWANFKAIDNRKREKMPFLCYRLKKDMQTLKVVILATGKYLQHSQELTDVLDSDYVKEHPSFPKLATGLYESLFGSFTGAKAFIGDKATLENTVQLIIDCPDLFYGFLFNQQRFGEAAEGFSKLFPKKNPLLAEQFLMSSQYLRLYFHFSLSPNRQFLGKDTKDISEHYSRLFKHHFEQVIAASQPKIDFSKVSRDVLQEVVEELQQRQSDE